MELKLIRNIWVGMESHCVQVLAKPAERKKNRQTGGKR